MVIDCKKTDLPTKYLWMNQIIRIRIIAQPC